MHIDLLSDNERCALLMKEARQRHDVSQQHIADLLGISRRTVTNWESGATAPTVPQVISWFSALGESPMPAFLTYMYPDKPFATRNNRYIVQALTDRFRHCTAVDMDMLLFIGAGRHGSSPHALLNLAVAYCHLPLKARINLCSAILQQFELASQCGNLSVSDDIMPDIECIATAKNKAVQAVKDGKEGY